MHPLLRWLIVLALTGAAGAGLSRFRVENKPGAWSEVAPPDGLPTSYVLIAAPMTDAQASDLAGSLRSEPSIGFVLDPETADEILPFMPIEDANLVRGQDGYRGVFAFPESGATDDALVADVRRTVDASGIRSVSLVGPAVFHTTLNAESQRGLPLVMGLITVVGGAALLLATGRVVVAANAMFALLAAQVALLGLASWCGQPMSMTLSLVPPLMMTLGFSFAAHWSMRQAAAGPLLLCLLTTGAGIGIFAFSPLGPIRAFGVWGVIGLCIALVWVCFVVPADRARKRTRVGAAPSSRGIRPIIWRVALGAGLAGGALALPRLNIQSNAISLFPADSSIVSDYTTMESNLTGGMPFFVETSGFGDAAREILLETPGIRAVMSLGSSSVIWCLADNDALPAIEAAMPLWQEQAARTGATLEVSGVARDLITMTNSVSALALWSLPLMGALAACSAGLIARRLDVAVGAALVNIWPIAVVIVALWALRLPLTVVDAFIGAIAIGVGADDTIHIAHALRRARSTSAAMSRVWRPCLASSLAAAACLLMFAFSPFPPTARFGVILACVLLLAVVADLLILPGLLVRDRRRPA